MLKKLMAGLCLLALIMSAAGCRLAKEESGLGSAVNQDRLIGVFVTTEYLDLFDLEGYIKDNPARVTAGGEISAGESAKYDGRIYAAQTIENGRTDYIFEGVEGIRYFVASLPATEFEGSSHASFGDPGISDGHTTIQAGDKESIVLEGTIYVSPTLAGHAFYFNPIYQDSEGKVYVMSGSGGTSSGDVSEGMLFSQSLKENNTETKNGTQTSYDETSITITVSVKYVPEKLVILQMSGDHTVLARDAYVPGSVPESLTPMSGTAYIISECYSTDAEGKTQVTRELLNNGAENIRSYHDRGDGILIIQDTKLDWQTKSGTDD